FTEEVCRRNVHGPIGLSRMFLHYTGADPAVASESGETLAPIAPSFAKSSRSNLVVSKHLSGHPVPVADRLLTTLCTGGDTCSDGIKDDAESDVDCGGLCKPCDDGRRCFGDGDCLSGHC